MFAKGGLDAAQELPERLFPWFIVAGVALAAQAGGHMSVEWLLGKLDTTGRRWLLLFGNAIVIVAYAVLFEQALEVAEIAKLESSPVLGLSGSHGYWAIALGCVLLALATLCSSVRIALTGLEPGSRSSTRNSDDEPRPRRRVRRAHDPCHPGRSRADHPAALSRCCGEADVPLLALSSRCSIKRSRFRCSRCRSSCWPAR